MPSAPSIPLIYTVTGARLPAPAGAERGGPGSDDDRIRMEVGAALMRGGDAADIEVHVAGRRVTLAGHVADRAAKRRAEDCAAAVAGVEDVQNDLRLRQPEDDTVAHASRVSETG